MTANRLMKQSPKNGKIIMNEVPGYHTDKTAGEWPHC